MPGSRRWPNGFGRDPAMRWLRSCACRCQYARYGWVGVRESDAQQSGGGVHENHDGDVGSRSCPDRGGDRGRRGRISHEALRCNCADRQAPDDGHSVSWTAMSRLIRALVVDDSLVMRSLLRMVLASDPSIELAGMAKDGVDALDAIDRIKPDLVLLDIEMPRMNGLEVLAELRSKHTAVKIIMCSTLTRRGARITLEALAHGATDYVTKPTAQNGAADAVATLARDLLPRIRALFPAPQTSILRTEAFRAIEAAHHGQPEIVVMGVSTGGPAALQALLPM